MGEPDKVLQLRMQRLRLAIGASAVTVLLAALVALTGYLPYDAAAIYAGIVAISCVAFYAVFRSGLNLRFSDPTLSVPQLVISGLAVSYLVYEGDAARAIFMAMYIMAFMFGMFTLTLRGLIGLALFYVACFIAVIEISLLTRPGQVDLNREIARILVFIILLAWMTVLGSHVNGLRQHLRRTNEELKETLTRFALLAAYDELTGLPNARVFNQQLARTIAEMQRTKGTFSLLYCDLDEFKPVNDALGHQAGDAMLREVAARLKTTLREADMVARVGGDEFVALATTCRSDDDAARFAERISSALSVPFRIGEREAQISCSIGIARYPDHAATAKDLLEAADKAMYAAKRAGRGRYASA